MVKCGNDYKDNLYMPSKYKELDILGILPKVAIRAEYLVVPANHKIKFVFMNQRSQLFKYDSNLHKLELYPFLISLNGNQYTAVKCLSVALSFNTPSSSLLPNITSINELRNLLDRSKTRFDGGNYKYGYDQVSRENLIYAQKMIFYIYQI